MYDTEKIRRLREGRAWTQEQLAELANVSLRTIQRLESGQTRSFATIQSVAQAFQVTVEQLRSQSAGQKKATVKDDEPDFLPRIMEGQQLAGVIGSAHFFSFVNDQPRNPGEAELIGGFLQALQDYGDIWEDLEASGRVQAQYSMQQQLDGLAGYGLWVFGARITKARVRDLDGPWSIAEVRVIRNDNPIIIRKGVAVPSVDGSAPGTGEA